MTASFSCRYTASTLMVAVLLVITFFFFSISEVQASDEVKINEILADPPAGQGEWIELYSTSGQFNLSGWILEDAAGTKKSLNNVEICGNFAVYQYSTDGWLNNTGSESIYLLDQNNNIIDQLINFTNPGESKTVGRTPDGNNNWQTIDSPSRCSSNGSNQPSQDQQQPTPTPSQTQTGQVWLSEFLPNPQEGNEWVEIFNPTSSAALDISGYKIDDIEGGSSPFTIPQGTIIGSQNYLYFSFSSRLNNDGDSVRLIDASGKVLEEYSYGKSTKGVSFAKNAQGAWQETTTPTPGAANIINKPQVEGTTTDEKTSQSTSKKTTTAKSTSTPKSSSKVKSATSREGGTVLSTSTEEAVLPQATVTAQDAATEESKVLSSKRNLLPAILFVAAGVTLLLGIGAKIAKSKKKK